MFLHLGPLKTWHMSIGLEEEAKGKQDGGGGRRVGQKRRGSWTKSIPRYSSRFAMDA
jgi:hypothetical protein